VTNDEYIYKLGGLVFQKGMEKLAKELLDFDTSLTFESE